MDSFSASMATPVALGVEIAPSDSLTAIGLMVCRKLARAQALLLDLLSRGALPIADCTRNITRLQHLRQVRAPRNASLPQMFHRFRERITDCARSLVWLRTQPGEAMANASELLREQAERCAQLANSTTDQSLARIMRAFAEDYWARADRLERRANAASGRTAPPWAPSVGGRAQPVREKSPAERG